MLIQLVTKRQKEREGWILSMGAAVAHFGIRYASDLTDEFSEYIVDSVDLLNAQLAPHGISFFFDAVDVDQCVIGGKCFACRYGLANNLLQCG